MTLLQRHLDGHSDEDAETKHSLPAKPLSNLVLWQKLLILNPASCREL